MDYAKFVSEHTEITSQVCSIFEDNDLSAEEGELILLWLAGISLGKRQASLTRDKTPLMMLAIGWQMGVENDDDD